MIKRFSIVCSYCEKTELADGKLFEDDDAAEAEAKALWWEVGYDFDHEKSDFKCPACRAKEEQQRQQRIEEDRKRKEAAAAKAAALKESRKEKLFVWDSEYMEDYGLGIVAAVAKTADEAREKIIAHARIEGTRAKLFSDLEKESAIKEVLLMDGSA